MTHLDKLLAEVRELESPIPGFTSYTITESGTVYSYRIPTRKKKPLKVVTSIHGYKKITLVSDAGSKRQCSIHGLLMLTFRGERPAGMHCAHIDGNPQNNALTNLAYVTPRENCQHKRGHGTYHDGEKHPRAKLTAESVAWVRRQLALGTMNQKQIAQSLGVDRTIVYQIRTGRIWASCKTS